MPVVVVSGAIANKCHNGGEAWVRLSWLRGFQKLGFTVHFVEQMVAGQCVDANGQPTCLDQSVNLSYFANVIEQFDLTQHATLIDELGEQSFGLGSAELLELADEAVVLINISGHLQWLPFVDRVRRKVLIDIDPAFTQLWHEAGNAGAKIHGHDEYFTIGENIAQPGCSVPTGNVRWRHTRQPVVLDDWPTVFDSALSRFTTIANWRGPYGPISHQGKTLGLKVHEFRKFARIPELVPQRFEIALNIDPADEKDLRMLTEHGWNIVDPRPVTSDPHKFRHYVQSSGAEFSVAQGVYVDTNCGWFSDRSVRYLASGKPVLVQDTGLNPHLPVGEGLLVFRNLEEAVAGAKSISNDYPRHSAAARRIAEQYFNSDKVVGKLVDEIGITP